MAKHFQVDTGGTLTTNLLAYYKMEDATDYFGSYNGTATSVTFSSGNGKVNNGGGFNGTSSYIDEGGATMPLSGDMSMVGWFNPSNVNSSYQFMWGKGSGSIPEGKVYLWGTNNHLVFYTGSTPLDSGVTAVNGTWYFVAVTVSGTTGKIYVNSTTPTSGTVQRSSLTATHVSIGQELGSGGQFAAGSIDEVGFWNKVLSTQEITDLYNGGSGQTMVSFTTHTQNITQSATGAVALAQIKTAIRSITQSAAVTASISKIKTAVRSITQTVTSVVSLVKQATFYRAITQSATASAIMTFGKVFFKTIAQTATATVFLARQSTFFRSLTQSATGVVSLTKAGMHYVALTVTAAISVTLSKARLLFHTIAQVAVATVSLSKQMIFVRTLAVTATIKIKLFLNGLQSIFGSRFKTQGTTFSDKYEKQNTGYTDKYQ